MLQMDWNSRLDPETPWSLLEEGTLRAGRTAQELTMLPTVHHPTSHNTALAPCLQLLWDTIQLALFLLYDSVLGLNLGLTHDSEANALP